MKKIWWVLSLAIVLLPIFVSADCVDLGRYTNWILETSHTVVLYAGPKPLARLETPNCEITPLSTIRLRKSYVCDLDDLVIDSATCHIITRNIILEIVYYGTRLAARASFYWGSTQLA